MIEDKTDNISRHEIDMIEDKTHQISRHEIEAKRSERKQDKTGHPTWQTANPKKKKTFKKTYDRLLRLYSIKQG